MEDIIKNKQPHLIMLGQDAGLLNHSSETTQRTLLYGQSFATITAYVFAKGVSKKEYQSENVLVSGFGTFFQSFQAFFKIYKRIRQLKKTNVSVLITTQDPFEIGFIGFLIACITRVPFHVQVHTDISSRYMQEESIRSRIQYFLSRIVLPQADRVRVVSKRLVRFCIEQLKIKNQKIDYVPMVYKRNLKKTEYIFGEGPQIIILPARFVWFKRIPLALEAFSIALEENKNIYLKIIGAGPMMQNIQKVIEKRNLSKHVEIVSWMNAEELYKSAALTVISSIYEGWCRVAVESVEAGVPVVMTDVGCAYDFIQNDKQGIIVPIENAYIFADAIQKVLSNKQKYLEYKNACSDIGEHIDTFDTYQAKVVRSWQATIS